MAKCAPQLSSFIAGACAADIIRGEKLASSTTPENRTCCKNIHHRFRAPGTHVRACIWRARLFPLDAIARVWTGRAPYRGAEMSRLVFHLPPPPPSSRHPHPPSSDSRQTPIFRKPPERFKRRSRKLVWIELMTNRRNFDIG